jgi:hypothetical protein
MKISKYQEGIELLKSQGKLEKAAWYEKILERAKAEGYANGDAIKDEYVAYYDKLQHYAEFGTLNIRKYDYKPWHTYLCLGKISMQKRIDGVRLNRWDEREFGLFVEELWMQESNKPYYFDMQKRYAVELAKIRMYDKLKQYYYIRVEDDCTTEKICQLLTPQEVESFFEYRVSACCKLVPLKKKGVKKLVQGMIFYATEDLDLYYYAGKNESGHYCWLRMNGAALLNVGYNQNYMLWENAKHCIEGVQITKGAKRIRCLSACGMDFTGLTLQIPPKLQQEMGYYWYN